MNTTSADITIVTDPIAVIERLDAKVIRAELDRLYEREAALQAAWKIARARDRQRERRQGAAHA
jgi:hypothetical protein